MWVMNTTVVIVICVLFGLALTTMFYALGVDRWALAGVAGYWTITLGTGVIKRMWSA